MNFVQEGSAGIGRIAAQVPRTVMGMKKYLGHAVVALVVGQTSARALHSIPTPHIDALQLQDVVQVSMKLTTPAEAQQVSDDIHRRFPMLGGNINRSYLDINRSEADKGWGLMRMAQSGNWKDSEILAIGDDKNDLPMIERFGGFTMTTAKPFMKEAAVKVYDSVGQMLLDNL